MWGHPDHWNLWLKSLLKHLSHKSSQLYFTVFTYSGILENNLHLCAWSSLSNSSYCCFYNKIHFIEASNALLTIYSIHTNGKNPILSTKIEMMSKRVMEFSEKFLCFSYPQLTYLYPVSPDYKLWVHCLISEFRWIESWAQSGFHLQHVISCQRPPITSLYLQERDGGKIRHRAGNHTWSQSSHTPPSWLKPSGFWLGMTHNSTPFSKWETTGVFLHELFC